MANVDKVIKDLVINEMSQEEFDAQKAAGTIAPNEIYVTPDKTDDKLDKKVSVIQGEENAGKILIVNEDGEVVPDKPKVGASLPILTHVFSDHELNDMSWLNADTFSWQSGDVYVAAYEHLANEAIFETETKKYIRCKTVTASGDYRDDDNVYYREPSYDFTSGEEQYEGYIFAWVATGSDSMVVTNTETPAESDVVHYYSKIYPEEPSPSRGRVVEMGEETFYSNAETETVDGITITFYHTEDGHKICLADQEANVQALYEATGIAWYYILDTVNKQFKLPRTKHAFTGLRDTVGKYVPAGVPNITGAIANTTWFYTGTGSSGAFTDSPNSNYAQTTTGTGSGTKYTLDASRSSSVYGNSNTVQPPATQMYLYFYVGNFERDAIEQTAGLNAEMFNNKVDTTYVNEQLATVNEQLATKANTDLSNTQFSLLKNNNGTLKWNNINMSAMCMPSKNIAIDLTLGASGANYTAPADGYIRCVIAADASGFIGMHNCYWQNGTNSGAYIGGMIPVVAGAIVGINYAGKQSVVSFKFIYAKGSEHLA